MSGKPREIVSENFRVPVEGVLGGAAEARLARVAVVGVTAEGEMYVAGSHSTSDVIGLFHKGEAEIERLRLDSLDGQETAPGEVMERA